MNPIIYMYTIKLSKIALKFEKASGVSG